MRIVYSGNKLTKEAQAVADDIADRCDTEIECWNAVNEYAEQSIENESIALQIREYCTFIQDGSEAKK